MWLSAEGHNGIKNVSESWYQMQCSDGEMLSEANSGQCKDPADDLGVIQRVRLTTDVYEGEVEKAIGEKENLLGKKYEKVIEAMKEVLNDSNAILEKHDHDPRKVLAEAPWFFILKHAFMTTSSCTMYHLTATSVQPDFGYIKTTRMDPNNAKLLNCMNNAFVNIEEILGLKDADAFIFNAHQYIAVSVHNPPGTEITVTISDNNDGIFTIRFTPDMTGEHQRMCICMVHTCLIVFSLYMSWKWCQKHILQAAKRKLYFQQCQQGKG